MELTWTPWGKDGVVELSTEATVTGVCRIRWPSVHEDGDTMHGELLDCAMQERVVAGLCMRKRTAGEDVMVGRKRKPRWNRRKAWGHGHVRS